MWPLEEPETASWSGGPGARDWRSDVDDQGLASWSGELEARSFPEGLPAPELAILGLFSWLAISMLIGGNKVFRLINFQGYSGQYGQCQVQVHVASPTLTPSHR